MKQVHVVSHPLVQELITKLRDIETGTEMYRMYTNTITPFLLYEALKDLKTKTTKVSTQTGETYTGLYLEEKLAFITLLRAGLGMFVSAFIQYPNAEFHSVGVKRDESDPFNKEPNLYLDRLDEVGDGTERIVIVDPMLATGGSMMAVIKALREKHDYSDRIDVVNLIAAKPGVEKINSMFPDIHFFCAGYDQGLNDKGYIVPGLGDAGDRYFGVNTDLESIR